MKSSLSGRSITACLLLVVSVPAAAQAGPTTGWDTVASLLQTTTTPSGGYQRYNLPRRDITLRVGGVAISPSLALGAWVGFSGTPANATMMGDLVLLTSELKPVLAELSRQNIDVSAIHNHLAGEEPQIRNVHFHAVGAATELARRLNQALALTATPRPVANATARPATFDTVAAFQALGTSGRAQGDIVQATYMLVPSAVTMHDHTVEPSLALRSPVVVQFYDSTRAFATGDFAVVASRVDPLLDALATNGITATAVHSHLVGEQPTIYYIHFWGDGRPADVLRGLRAAADAGRVP